MSEQLLNQIDELFTRRLGVFAEDVQHRFDLLAEGQQLLVERVDRMETELRGEIAAVDRRLTTVHVELDRKIEAVDQKLMARIDAVEEKLTVRIDAVEQTLSGRLDAVEQTLSGVAADLAAHRRDTEAHGGYRVGE